MKKVTLLSIILIFQAVQVYAQTVETVVSDPKILDGLHVDSEGNIYTTSGGLANGVDIGKYNVSTSEWNSSFATGFSGPIDIVEDQNGLFVVTNYDNNTVSSLDLNTNQVTTIATGLDGPSGLVKDDNGNIYVANFGAPPTYSGHQIHKITPSGQVSIFVDSNLISTLQPMTINGDGDLIIESQGNLYKIDLQTADIQFWASVGMNIGHLKFRPKDSHIYATAPQAHKILKIDTQGVVTVFSGSVAGYNDGPIGEALFRNPLGIEFSPDEDIIYISEAGYSTPTGRIRRIILDPLGVDDFELASANISPNPGSDEFTISLPSVFDELDIKVFNIIGTQVISEEFSNRKSIKIDVSKLSSGQYIVHLITNKGLVVKKFIKK